MFSTKRSGKLLSFLSDKYCVIGFAWTVGAVVGILFAVAAGSSFFSVMDLISEDPVSIVTLCVPALLPFLISALAVSMGRPKILPFICACRSFCVSSCAYLSYVSCGSAGWLIQPLLQFSGLCMAPLLCWFCIRHFSGSSETLGKDLLICTVAALVLCGVDAYVISPFLAELIHF